MTVLFIFHIFTQFPLSARCKIPSKRMGYRLEILMGKLHLFILLESKLCIRFAVVVGLVIWRTTDGSCYHQGRGRDWQLVISGRHDNAIVWHQNISLTNHASLCDVPAKSFLQFSFWMAIVLNLCASVLHLKLCL